MKNIFLILSLVIFALTSSAKEYSFSNAEKLIAGSEKVITDDKTGAIKYIKLKSSHKVSVSKNVAWLNTVLNISSSESFGLYKKETDQYGFTHYKYRQLVSGVPVEDGVFYIHTKNGFIISANGEYYPNIKLGSTSTNISPAGAIKIAKSTIKKNTGKWNEKIVSAPIKVVVSNGNGNYAIAFKTDVYSQTPLARKFVYVDAVTGKVIKERNRIHNADVVGSAATKYSGTQVITADSIGAGSYILTDNGRNVHTFDLNNAYFISSAVDFTDTDNYWNNVNAQQDEVAGDAHWAAESFYDYFSTTFGINSYDNAGSPLNTYVHYGVNYDNAFWDGTSISCGDGNGSNHTPHTALDIIAHEFSHGIIENTANLVGSYESGSLSESYGDIFGTAVEYYAKPGSANYTFGENISTSSTPYRSLSNPNQYSHPDTYLGTNWATGPADNGGIHTNNGVQNYWFYLLTNGGSGVNDIGSSYSVTGIGMLKAVSIAYRTLTVYLTTNSQYTDARTYSIQAAVDLYGACSAEAVATQNAWYAVGVGTAASNSPVVASFSTDIQYSCSVPTTVNFTDLSQNATTSHTWYFGDGDSSSVSSPSHTYTSAGTYTVTLIVEGIGSCGTQTDTLTLVNLITVTNGGGPVGISCSPATTNAGTLNMGIFNFTLNTINNSTTLGGADSYQDYSCSQSTTLTEGNTYNVNITTGSGYSENVKIWIDFDNNGVFASVAEKVFESNNIFQNHSGTVSVPGGAVLNTPLRLRVSSDYYNNTVDVCTNPQYGQHEDYTVVLIPNTNPPVVDFTADNVVVNVSQVVNFTDLSQNVPTGWTWDFTGATPPNSSLQNPSVSYSALGTYTVKLRATNTFGADSLTKTAYISVVNQSNMCGAVDSTNATSGQLFDSGGASGNYSNNENCSFLINPGCATSVTLSFSSFNIESGYDNLRVYDGVDATGTLILTATGSSLPGSVTASSGTMFINFTSDGSVIYSGFDASWSSSVPTSAPTANFSMSNNNPPLNTVVNFTDLSTNYPGAWTWDFGDGSFAYTQNPAHIYTTSGTYAVQLITDNCFSNDTISYNLTVQGAPSITVLPNPINATVSCGDSINVPYTIYNSGSGQLITSIDGASAVTSTGSFFDGFEDGTYNNWNVVGSNTYQIITSNPATGNYCLAITGSPSSGLEYTFTPDTIDYFSVKLRSDDISGTSNYCYVGDVSYNWGIGYIYHNGSNQYVVGGSTTINHTITNLWTFIEFKNINYSARTFDVYADGNLIYTSMGFNNAGVNNMSEINLFNYDASYTGYYDDIQVGVNVLSNWITIPISDTIVAPNDSVVSYLTLDASNLFAGTYYDTLLVNSNDSTNSPLYLPVTFTVTGQPIISASPSSINFGTLQVGASATDTLYIDNLGCDTLDISSFTSTNVSFTVAGGGFQIPPFSNDTVIITFSPDTIKTYADTIFINNNDTTAFVLVNGVGIGSPIISYNPTAIIDTIFGCNDSITIPVTVYNTGQGPLYTSININGVTSGSAAAFFDGFESGTYSNWNVTGTNTYNVTTASPASGSYCLSITGNNTSGLEYTFTPDTIDYFSIKLRSDAVSGNSNYCYVGNTANNWGIAYFHYIASSNQYRIGGSTTVLHNITSLWTHFELKNINYVTKTYDIYVNGSLFYPNMGFGNSTITGMSEINLFDYDASYSGYYDDVQIGQAISPQWISTNIDTLNTAINDSSIFLVTLYSAGLSSGTYNTNIVLASNDPISLYDTIPVSFTVDGIPEIALSNTCLNYGAVMENTTNNDTLTVYNNGCDTLFVTNVTSGMSEYTTSTTSLAILPGDSGVIYVTFSPTSIGTFNSSLTIFNNDIDTTICLTGTATGAPVISVNPTSFNVNLSACQDSITLPFTIYNTGGSNLELNIVGSSGGTIEVLALTYGVDMGTEYPNTISAINTYFTNYNLTQLNTTVSSTLQAALVGKDVFLIPEQESGSSSVFSGFATVLQNFVNSGGTVIFCGSASGYSQAIFNTGLFSGSYGGNLSSGTLTLVNSTHALANSVTTPISASNATFYYNITNGDAYSILEYGGNPVITYREPGLGKAIIVGYDYYNTNSNSSQFIANAIEWGGNGSIASWLNLSQYSDTIVPSDSTIIYVTFYSSGLSGGAYYTDITINSNDPVNPQILVPCTLNISFDPCADFTFTAPNSCSGQVNFTDATLNTPTSWQWAFGDGNSSNMQNPTNMYAAPGNYNVQLIACNSTSCDTVSYMVSITSTNGPIAAFCMPITTSAGTLGMGIFNFTFNTINNSTNGGTDSYQDYTCTSSTTVTEGNSYNVNITTGTGYSEDVRVWIDFNNDGQFNMTNELVFSSDNVFQNHSGSVAIPTGSILNTSLRMRVASDYEGNTITSSCTDVLYGQHEDYTILIQSNMQPPNSNYIYTILDQCQGIVQFTDMSTNFPTSWLWNFDDGNTSTFQNPFHTYASAGIYNVTLTATNTFGSDIYNQQITLNSLNATIDILSPTTVNQPINFNANAPGAIAWSWDFGDGYSANIQSPSHTYTSTGTYVVTLIATNGFGCSSTVYDTIYVNPVSIEEYDSYFTIYPNPNNGTLQITNKSNQNITTINIINTLGEIVFRFENETNHFSSQKIEMNDVSTGVYFVKVLFEDNNFITRKFLIRK